MVRHERLEALPITDQHLPTASTVGNCDGAKCKRAVALPKFGQGPFDCAGRDTESVCDDIDSDADKCSTITA